MDEDIEFQIPKNKQPLPTPPTTNRMEVNVDLGDLLKNDFSKIVEAIEKGRVVNFPDIQNVKGVVTLEDKKVEVDFSDVLNALNRIEESSKEVTVTNQPDPSKGIKELRVAIVKAIKQAAEQKPEVVVNNPDKIEAKITNSKPSEAIPVTLTDKAQKKFVEAVTNIMNSGGGGGFPSQIAVTNPDGSVISGGGGGSSDMTATNELLQEIADNTDTLELKAESINLNTDGIETKLDTLHADLDTVETKLQAISDNTDGLEGKDFATQTTLAAIKAKTDNLLSSGQATMANSSPVVIASNQSAVDVNTELPAAAALGDTDANYTAPAVGAANMVWDGQNSLWKRARTAPSTATTTLIGTQVPAYAPTVYGAANTLRVQGSASIIADANTGTTMPAVAGMASNGTTWDMVRSGAQSNVAAATGFQATLGVGQYNATPPTITDTRYNHLQLDVNGNLRTTLATALDKAVDSITVAQFGHSYLQTAADALVKSGSGVLLGIVISQADAAPTAGSIDIYDNTTNSGTKIFTHTQTTAVFMPVSIQFNAAFTTGLYIDFTTTADVSVTLIYR